MPQFITWPLHRKPGDYASVKNYKLQFNKKINNVNNFLQKNLSSLGSIFLLDTTNKLGLQIGDNRPSLDISMSYLKELEELAITKKDTGSLVLCYLYLSQVCLAKGDKETAMRIGLKGWDWCKKFSSTGTFEDYLDALGKIYFPWEIIKNLRFFTGIG
jgi:hypothetical protein